jgi:hypothetical protein
MPKLRLDGLDALAAFRENIISVEIITLYE